MIICDEGPLVAPRATRHGDTMSTRDLPYSPAVSAVLEPLRTGFRYVNRYLAVPMIRCGAGPLLVTPQGGSILVLRTRGRKSGLVREAPLGYAVVDGRIVVVAGYGRGAHWFRNALADPQVEVALPGAVFAGTAEEITDPAERRRAFRVAAPALGTVGRLTLGDVATMPDDEVDTLAEAFPVLAVTPTAVRTGPYEPGGAYARRGDWLWFGALAALGLGCRRRRRRRRASSR